MIVMGVDPGIHGGLAIVAVEDGAAPRLVEAIDIPVIGIGAKERVDVAAIRNFIDQHKPIRALIERAQAMPKQGSVVGFKYGRAVGAIEAAIALSGIPVTIVEPSVWKRFWHLRAKTRKAGGSRRCSCFRPRMRRSRARKIMAGPRHR